MRTRRILSRWPDERGKGPDRIQVLINKVPVRTKPDLDGLEKFLGPRPTGVYSDDTEALYETWSEGRLLGGESVLGRQLKALAKSLIAAEAAQPADSNTDKSGENRRGTGGDRRGTGFGTISIFYAEQHAGQSGIEHSDTPERTKWQRYQSHPTQQRTEPARRPDGSRGWRTATTPATSIRS